jgi:hypothetical protein
MKKCKTLFDLKQLNVLINRQISKMKPHSQINFVLSLMNEFDYQMDLMAMMNSFIKFNPMI